MPNSSKETSDFNWRNEHIGRLLFEVLNDFQFRSLEKIKALGYDDISFSSISIMASTHINGTRLTDIAKNLDISKQAAGQMVKDLVKKGYLSRQPDPEDGRATLVTFTKKGKSILQEVGEDVKTIEAHYSKLLGKKN